MPSDAVEQKFKWLCATLDKCVLDRDALISKCAAYMILYRGECHLSYAFRGRERLLEEFTLLQAMRIDQFSAQQTKAMKLLGAVGKEWLKQLRKQRATKATLSEGRKKGARSQKLAAQTKRAQIVQMNSDLLKLPRSEEWTLTKRINHIRETGPRPQPDKRYSVATIKQMISRKDPVA